MDQFESALLPVLPLKDIVIFPNAITPIYVIRPDSLRALEASVRKEKRVFIVSQSNPEAEDPTRNDLHNVGCVAEVLQVLTMPDQSAKVLIEGQYAARVVDFSDQDTLQALVVRLKIDDLESSNTNAYMRLTKNLFDTYSRLSDKIPEDLYSSISNIKEPLPLINSISNYSAIDVQEKQRILEALTLEEKFMLLNTCLEYENQILELEEQITSQVKDQIGQSQREYFLNEQLRAIERELGVSPDEQSELEEMHALIEKSGMSEEAKAKAEKELTRLARMPPLSPEATVARTYIEWLTDVPWQDRSEDSIDLSGARKILDKDHYGLEKVKDRIIEHLAVIKLAGNVRGPILCFVGPPGVGKTSLAQSIARCMGRKFARISLGGVRDEAEIRGHRRTYVGALPGKIVQSMKKAATVNPVLLLDEIDKMSSDFRGDPGSALLEVLDPQQNKTFNDHYLEVDYDLSQTMFITTANTTSGIPLPLQDRMEIIRLPGYTEMEKLEIARRHLIPRTVRSHGFKASQVRLRREAILSIIRSYTREAGVRNLERNVQSVCRKLAAQVIEAREQKSDSATETISVTRDRVGELLGPEHFQDRPPERGSQIGNALGLAWTEVGGELLHVETRVMPGKGNLTLTGKLGDVMQESARMALSFIRSRAEDFDVDSAFYRECDVHIHLPEGAIPKDGPSAGITLATSLVSALSSLPVRQDIAMTGEMTLRGNVLKIGGLKEKVLAAFRNRVLTVLLPGDNVSELQDIPQDVAKKMTFIPVNTFDDVLESVIVGWKKKGGAKAKSPTKKARRPRKGSPSNHPRQQLMSDPEA